MAEAGAPGGDRPALEIADLHVYYGQAHALQGIGLRLTDGVLAVVGRNGMGKTTLCNAIMGLVAATRGSVRAAGVELIGLAPNEIVGHGVAYVPQGRRVWPSLSVEEHLRVALRPPSRESANRPWTIERIYETFPRLAERRRSGGGALSGGEQQMLAISRALLANPRLLVMDEPTEGLAPVLVEQVSLMLRRLAEEREISVLLIEQNLGIATAVASRVAIMVNGRIAREMPAAELAGDDELQQRLLGVRSGADEAPPAAAADIEPEPMTQMFRVVRGGDAEAPALQVAPGPVYSAARAPTLWSQGNPLAGSGAAAAPRDASNALDADAGAAPAEPQLPIAAMLGRVAYVAGTFDTKGRELSFLADRLRALGLRTVTIDLGTSRRPSIADIGPLEVAGRHPRGAPAVFGDDRGAAVTAMAEAFERFILSRRDLGGLIAAGGSGGTALATPAMRRLPIGVPKVMVSTVASGDVNRYVGASDICMMYSVTDVSGINRISEQVLSNAAHALAGMIMNARRGRDGPATRPAIGLTMFGLTTPCVQAVAKALEDRFDCVVFHATGTGGESMEKLVDSGLLSGLIDVTTTEIADLLMGGVFRAHEDRIGAVIRSRVPYVASCGALDMVNFGPVETVPERYRGRTLHKHNAQVTLMRTTPEENIRMGRWIADRLNRCDGPVRFLIPQGGVSLLDRPGAPFHDPAADAALFKAIEDGVRQTERRRVIRLPHELNEPAFAEALVRNFIEIGGGIAARGAA
jgi:uncharacterized protein (UPF0261 family)/ABC-type branched-subunit amino acid transport system ATPase component